MPRKPKRPCRYPGCPNLTDGGVYCEKHEKVMQRRYEKFQRGYSPGKRYGRAWKRIRDRYIGRHPLCEMCLTNKRYIKAEEVHHIIPLSEGGTHEEANLMSLCRSCHEKIHKERGDR
ncbi:HNH endonuclease [Megasphaera vaginalis (ex Bordigoni et al. 2020)]|uniref:HNH endonuclease n=1 Tax=Megasphaera vaginalis (ex Bordigoni et al. 2020) TaxID=2045301 RepID=UPI000C7C0782|nr:HNH endonuclease [Megasphaera vaginalis (ex Bordigoni et al. 2020)]